MSPQIGVLGMHGGTTPAEIAEFVVWPSPEPTSDLTQCIGTLLPQLNALDARFDRVTSSFALMAILGARAMECGKEGRMVVLLRNCARILEIEAQSRAREEGCRAEPRP